jgi:hypothetical protein
MRERCADENNAGYEDYGGRGIAVCPRWLDSFENFLEDMGERPDGKTLDRYPDVNGNYDPKNCRWATAEEQANNRNSTRWLSFNGETLSLTQWARRAGLTATALCLRLNRYQWTVERALSTPLNFRRAA